MIDRFLFFSLKYIIFYAQKKTSFNCYFTELFTFFFFLYLPAISAENRLSGFLLQMNNRTIFVENDVDVFSSDLRMTTGWHRFASYRHILAD